MLSYIQGSSDYVESMEWTESKRKTNRAIQVLENRLSGGILLLTILEYYRLQLSFRFSDCNRVN